MGLDIKSTNDSIGYLGGAGTNGGYNPGLTDYGMQGWNLYQGWAKGKDEKEYMDEILGLKKDDMFTGMAMKEASAYDAMNTRNRNLAGWSFNAANPGATDEMQRANLVNRISDYNRNDVIVDVNGGQTDLIPGGIIPDQYTRETSNGAPNGVGSTPGNPNPAAGQSQNATVAAGPAKPVTTPGTNSSFNNKKRVNNNAYIG